MDSRRWGLSRVKLAERRRGSGNWFDEEPYGQGIKEWG